MCLQIDMCVWGGFVCISVHYSVNRKWAVTLVERKLRGTRKAKTYREDANKNEHGKMRKYEHKTINGIVDKAGRSKMRMGRGDRSGGSFCIPC